MKKIEIVMHILAWVSFISGVFFSILGSGVCGICIVLGILLVGIAFLLEFLMNTVELKKS